MGSSVTILVAVVVTFALLRVAHRALLVVPSERVFVIERLGKFHAVLAPGLHLLVPFIDRVVREFRSDGELLEAPEQRCVALDGESLEIACRMHYVARDPQCAVYSVSDLSFSLLQLLQGELQQAVRKVQSSVVRGHPGSLEGALLSSLNPRVAAWGIELLKIEARLPSR